MSQGIITVQAGPLYASDEGFDELVSETRRRIIHQAYRRRDVAEYYSLLISLNRDQRDLVPWADLNRAIVERWSLSALDFIKKAAWAMLQPKRVRG